MEEMNRFEMPRQEQEANKLLDKRCATPEEWIRRQDIKEAILETAEIAEKKELQGSNEVIFTQFKDGGKGIFKPQEGEDFWLREHVKGGEYYKRERASFLVDKFLGFNMVPTTIIREVEGRVGSMQEFVPNAKSGLEMNEEEREANAAEFYKLGVLDFIIWNSDRARHNYLATENKIHAIDNGLSFGKDVMVIPEVNFLVNHKAPAELIQNLDTFSAGSEWGELLKKNLLELVSEEEAEACMNRIAFVRKALHTTGELTKETVESMLNNELYNPKQ